MISKSCTSKLGSPPEPGAALVLLFFAALALPLVFAACSKNQGAPAAQAKHYNLHGTVVSIDQNGGALMINGDEIPGFMGAMTMPYPVHNQADLTRVSPGDEITARIVVPDNGPSYIDNIVIVKKGSGVAPKSSSELQPPQDGQTVPDFSLIDQTGKRIRLGSYRGKALLVTFIYTRCPMPDFCPLVSKNFAHIYAETQSNPSLLSQIRLLSVSFDPANDTPPVLRKFGESFRSITVSEPFDRWEFAVIPKNELNEVTSFFGVSYSENKDQFVHSMSTSVITPDGKIYSWREDTDWKPEELIADATEALLPQGERTTVASDHSAGHEIAPPTGAATN